MERHVDLDGERVGVLDLLQGLDDGGEQSQILPAALCPPGGEPSRADLEDESCLDDLADAPFRRRSQVGFAGCPDHEGAAADAGLDEPVSSEHTDGLAHGRPADAELGGECALGR